MPDTVKKLLFSILEIAEVTLITVGSVFLVRTFVVQPFVVSGKSMVPSFSDGDYLLIDEVTYRTRQPHRGEVIVFRYPNNESTYFIKRIIGLPGDHVSIRDGSVIIANREYPTGTVLSEAYLPAGTKTMRGSDMTLGSGEYFVLGDNRSASFDSREWGVVKSYDVVGLVRVRLWPPTAFASFPTPHYSYSSP